MMIGSQETQGSSPTWISEKNTFSSFYPQPGIDLCTKKSPPRKKVVAISPKNPKLQPAEGRILHFFETDNSSGSNV